MTRLPPRSTRPATLCPYTTLFLSVGMGNPRSPLGFVDSLVAGKQFQLPLRAEPVEAGGKVVMDEHVLRAGDAHAGGLGAAALVAVLEEPAAERPVPRPDHPDGGPRHGQLGRASCGGRVWP